MLARGYRADRKLTFVEIERRALARRQDLVPGLLLDQPMPCAELFERIDETSARGARGVVRLDYGVQNLPRGIEGQARYDERRKRIVIELAEPTYRSLRTGKPRSRVTFLHELGHADLHTDQLVRMSTIPHRVAALQRATEPPHDHCIDTEWQATAYAIALLMPARGLAELERRFGRLTVPLLQQMFSVSYQAAGIRLQTFVERRTQLLA